MNLAMGIFAGLVMIGFLVVMHELGHFLFARLFGIGTPVFSVGVGSRLWGFRWRGTDFRISALPFGGYVQMSGVDPFGDEDPDGSWVPPEQNFMNKPVWQRLVVMAAGPVFNLLLPIPLFMLVLMVGQPEADTTIGQVLPGTPASEAGLKPGDRLVAIDGTTLNVWEDWARLQDRIVGQPVDLVYERDGVTYTASFGERAFTRTFDGFLDEERFGLLHYVPSPRIGVDLADSPAARAGLATGDLVRKVDGVPVKTWDALLDALATGPSHELEIVRASPRWVGTTEGKGAKPPPAAKDQPKPQELTLTITRDHGWTAPADDPLVDPTWGLVPIQVYVSEVVADSPAKAAGIEAGDRLIAVDGAPVRSWSEVTWLVQKTVPPADAEVAEPRELELTVLRRGERLTKAFTPMLQREVVRGEPRFRPIIGVYPFGARFVAGEDTIYRYSVAQALPLATNHTANAITKVFRILGHLMTGQLRPKESVGGPVAMLQIATEAVEYGFWTVVQTAAMISVSLGIVNLLPVPVLDGGHIVFYAIEGLRGRPLPLALRERIQMVGVLVLSVVMVLVLAMDVMRWVEGGTGS